MHAYSVCFSTLTREESKHRRDNDVTKRQAEHELYRNSPTSSDLKGIASCFTTNG